MTASGKLDSRLLELLSGPNFAHVASHLPSGEIHITPVWVDLIGSNPVFFKEESSVAYRNLIRDERLAISIIAADQPYVGGYIRGRVTDRVEAPGSTRWLNQRAIEYTSNPYPPELDLQPGSLQVVEVDHSFSYEIPNMTHNPSASVSVSTGGS